MHYIRIFIFTFKGKSIKSFFKAKENLYFTSCDTCPARCCDGKEGSIYAQVILLDFEKIYKNFTILFTFGELGYLKPVVLLSNGKDHCIYIKDYKCTVYEERPSICRVYPLSANLDNIIYYDTNCPAISDMGYPLITNNEVAENFNSEILDDYQYKYVLTHREFEPFNNKEEFELIATINHESFYKYIGTKQSSYMDMHLESLKNLKKYNL